MKKPLLIHCVKKLITFYRCLLAIPFVAHSSCSYGYSRHERLGYGQNLLAKTQRNFLHSVLIVSILLITSTASGQQLEKRPYFTVSYFGILATHPGVKIGFQYPLHTFDQENLAGELNQIIGSTNMIFYFHRKNHIGAGLNVELGFSHKKPDGINKEILLGVGYLRTFIPHSIYDFDGQNGGEKRRFLGVNHLLKTAAIGLGKNVDIDIFADSWMIKPTLLHIKPYNTGSTLNFALDVGYQFRK